MIDCKNIDWTEIEGEKLDFIYKEAWTLQENLGRDNTALQNKAAAFLAASVPALSSWRMHSVF